MRERWTVVINDPAHLSATHVGCAEVTKWIDVVFGVETRVDPENILLDVVPVPHSLGVAVLCGLCQITFRWAN